MSEPTKRKGVGLRRAIAAVLGLSPLVLVGVGVGIVAGEGYGMLAAGLLLYVDLRFPRRPGT